MPYRTNSSITENPSRFKRLLLGLLLLAAVVIAVNLLFLENNEPRGDQPVQNPVTAAEKEEEPEYTPVNLQPIIEQWEDAQRADYSIVVYDLQSKSVIGSLEPDREFFAASLYKQYVAYLALLDIQNGSMDPDEVLWGGNTNKTCVDMMIRESHSPCGEAMMAKIGQTTLNQRVADMGMTGTYFNGIRTTAHDSALILQYIAEGRDLNEEDTAFLRDAMRNQDDKWRRGLARGAPEAQWETKVGWNEDANYHDIGIMTLPDGRAFAVTILGQGSGASAPIADFARTIYEALTTGT